MMKKYIIIIFTLFLLGISLQYAGINFGSSRLTDSTSYITTNRPFMVNGNLNFTGTLLQNGSAYSSSGIDTNSYFNKYRLDTSKYFNPYRLDTAKILFTDQQNGYALFDSTYNGRLITNGDLFMNDGGNIVWRTTPQLSIFQPLSAAIYIPQL